MQFYDIEPALLESMKTVENVVDVKTKLKSDNVNFFIVELVDGANEYDFRAEFDQLPQSDDYIVIVDIPGYDYNKYVGVVDAVRDLTTFCLQNYQFDPRTPVSNVTDECKDIIQMFKENVPVIAWEQWIEYEPEPHELDALQ